MLCYIHDETALTSRGNKWLVSTRDTCSNRCFAILFAHEQTLAILLVAALMFLSMMFAIKVTNSKSIVNDMYASKPISKEKFLELSYRNLTELTGISIKHWSHWFNRKASPNFDTLEQIALDLGMPPLELIEAFMERRSRTVKTRNGKSSVA